MNEEQVCFHNKNSRIFGVKHIPSEKNELNRICVLFLHGWLGYRVGPHDLFVKLARKITQKGFTSLRFDFRGRGYSEGDQAETDFGSMLSDVKVVVDEIYKYPEIEKIVFIGICSGAKLGFYYIKHEDRVIDHLIALSSPLLNDSDTLKVNFRQSAFLLSEYFFKLLDKTTYQKIYSKEINYKRVYENLTSPITRSIRKFGFSKFVQHSQRKSEFGSFKNFNGGVLAVHGTRDPESQQAIKQIALLLERYQVKYEIELIAGANHSFYHIAWEAQILSKIVNWLTEKYHA